MTRVFALVGPTAVGKTDLSIELAKRLDAEIVGCDSMQVYRRMAALTQQPTAEQRAAVAHHLVDCVEPSERFNAGAYRSTALEAIERARRSGRGALIVGGTGLYLRALMDGLCDAPPADPQVREAILSAMREQGAESVYERLKRVDPVACRKIHPNDAHRVVRALEVYEISGRPLSSFWNPTPSLGEGITVIGVNRPREELYERIDRRVERMLDDERVLDEARELSRYPLSSTAAQAHGLRFLTAYLAGELSRRDAVSQWQQQVRHYARRQLIWFRAEQRIRWVGLSSGDSMAAIVDRTMEARRESERTQMDETSRDFRQAEWIG